LYVGNRATTSTTPSLEELFSRPFGSSASAHVIQDATRPQQGFWMVEIADDNAARTALAELTKKTVVGPLDRHEAKPPSKSELWRTVARSSLVDAHSNKRRARVALARPPPPFVYNPMAPVPVTLPPEAPPLGPIKTRHNTNVKSRVPLPPRPPSAHPGRARNEKCPSSMAALCRVGRRPKRNTLVLHSGSGFRTPKRSPVPARLPVKLLAQNIQRHWPATKSHPDRCVQPSSRLSESLNGIP